MKKDHYEVGGGEKLKKNDNFGPRSGDGDFSKCSELMSKISMEAFQNLYLVKKTL